MVVARSAGNNVPDPLHHLGVVELSKMFGVAPRKLRITFVPNPTNASHLNPIETHFRTIRRWAFTRIELHRLGGG